MTQHLELRISAGDGVELGAWLFLPEEGAGPFPAITMAVGFAGLKEHQLQGFARAFAQAGFVVVVHDHRNFGSSGGTERGDIDPWRQIDDWRMVISWLEARPEVDPERIGLWGTSYAGGHALVLGATDRRIKAVVSQVPTISGIQQGLRRVAPDQLEAYENNMIEADRSYFRTGTLARMAVVDSSSQMPAAYRSEDAQAFYMQPLDGAEWENSMTVRSVRAARMYEPGLFVAAVSPTPLLMIVAERDRMTPTDLALAAYERALAPKELTLIRGGHFSPYLEEFKSASEAALTWFTRHLDTNGKAAE
ncbi:alpha/beta hydrolase [Devosia sp. A369]